MPTTEHYHFPAEWEPHAATWLTWPHNAKDWPGKFGPIQWVFVEIIRALTPGELVRLIVTSEKHEAQSRRALGKAGVDLARVEFFPIPCDRGWCRDSGPIFVRAPHAGGKVVIADFAFTGWAKYDNHTLDNQVPCRAAAMLDMERIEPSVETEPLVLEGGAIDCNGVGTLLTTRECLLDHTQQPRNAHLSQQQLEAGLRRYLGVEHVIYLDKGIVGDDTGGHIDDLARFVNPTTIVLCRERNSQDDNYAALSLAAEQLASARLADGHRPDVVPLPMPAPLYFEGVRLPASYANFLIGNEAVLVPTFNDPADRIALGTLAELFPERRVVGIHAVDLVWGFGTIHCLTQQQPA